jgi:hypothetical protein
MSFHLDSQEHLMEPVGRVVASRTSQTSPAAREGLHAAHSSHRESDDAYPTLVQVDDRTRVISCKDDLQWILQRRQGGKWCSIAFCRTRGGMVQAANAAGCAIDKVLVLPERHDGLIDNEPRCHTCGRLSGKPKHGLPRNLFCGARAV